MLILWLLCGDLSVICRWMKNKTHSGVKSEQTAFVTIDKFPRLKTRKAQFQDLVFLISRVWVIETPAVTLYHSFDLWIGRVKPLFPCVVQRMSNNPVYFLSKEKWFDPSSWLRLLYAPRHLVNPYKVQIIWVSESITAITYLSESLYKLSALISSFVYYERSK